MVITFFSVEDKEQKFRFFEEMLLLANINIVITLRMPFITLNNVKIDFVGRHI